MEPLLGMSGKRKWTWALPRGVNGVLGVQSLSENGVSMVDLATGSNSNPSWLKSYRRPPACSDGGGGGGGGSGKGGGGSRTVTLSLLSRSTVEERNFSAKKASTL